jgi:3D (Asp-Asp-Asp) domain-containing protein
LKTVFAFFNIPASAREDEKLSIFSLRGLSVSGPADKSHAMTNSKRIAAPAKTQGKLASAATLAWAPVALALGIAFLPGCAKKTACLEQDPAATLACSPDKLFAKDKRKKTLTVTATAYTAQSVGQSRKSLPRAANGERLTPDVSAIAVSPDLVDEYGLELDKTVHIDGLDGNYKIMDLMSPRHSKTIDIYFGNDQAAARQWGRRVLTLTWE